MSQFSSKTPRDLNHDPEPWVSKYHGVARRSDAHYDHWDKGQRWGADFSRSPRPEFDHVQHNEPNPVLLRVRESAERAQTNNIDLSTRADMWLLSMDNLALFGGFTSWDSPNHPRHVLTTASDAEINHARRVLTRLANLSQIGED